MAKTGTMFILFSMMMAMLGGYAAEGRYTPEDAAAEEWFKNAKLAQEEKFTKLHFYMHDFVTGPNQSVYVVANASITSSSETHFGRVQVLDHLITVGLDVESEKVGRIQGMNFFDDLHETALGVNWNVLLNDGSTITVLGRLVAADVGGELSIVGGTGEYLMARGIAFKRTVETEPVTSNSIFEFTLYVYSVNLLLPAGLQDV